MAGIKKFEVNVINGMLEFTWETEDVDYVQVLDDFKRALVRERLPANGKIKWPTPEKEGNYELIAYKGGIVIETAYGHFTFNMKKPPTTPPDPSIFDIPDLPPFIRRTPAPEESKFKKLKEKWSAKVGTVKSAPGKILDTSANIIGRAVIPDRTIRRAFRGPLTTEPPFERLPTPPHRIPPSTTPPTGSPEGFSEEYEKLLKEFARWYEYVYQNRDVLTQPERIKLEAIERGATELEDKPMVGRESYQEALSQLRSFVNDLKAIYNSVSARIGETTERIRAGQQRGPPIRTPTPEEPTERKITGVAPGATVTERYGGGRQGEGPPVPPEGRREDREERRGRGSGAIRGTVLTKVREEKREVEKPVRDVEIEITGPRNFKKKTGANGMYYQVVPATIEGVDYKIKVLSIPKGLKKPPENFELTVTVYSGEPQEADDIFLESEEEKLWTKAGKGVQKGLPWLNPAWWMGRGEFKGEGANWWKVLLRIGISLTLTLVLYFAVYRPTFGALGQNLGFANVIIPFLFFLIMFFTLPKFDGTAGDLAPFIIGVILALGTFFALMLATKGVGRASFIQWGVPIAVYLFAYYTTKQGKSPTKTLITVSGALLLIGGIMLTWNLISSGAAFNIETYLKTLDVLHLVGVPQDTIDNVKDGVRNVLSFLQFKGAEPLKPEAKKIGGFEAIQLKFGSRYNDFLLPTLFARTNYTLPVTVINPNKLDTKLTVENFVIDNAFMNNKSSRILCGSVTEGNSSTGKSLLGDIDPEEERLTTIEFGNKTNCETVVKTFSNVQNPMFPDKFTLRFENKNTGNKLGDCQEVCKNVVTDHNTRYQLSPGDRLDVNGSRYLSGDDMCECKVNKVHNVLDNLCFFDRDKAQISLKTSYGFKVQGKGELILVKSDADKKLAPKPSITSGAGPITVTTYFVSDVHVFGTSTQAKNMFIEIRNDGEGNAKITGLAINGFGVSKFYDSPPLAYIPLIKEDPEKVKITNCSPNPTVLSVSKESATIICTVKAENSSIVASNYRTLPAIVDVNYTYSQTHSTSVNIKKESIPDGVTDRDQIIELDINFKPLPYYCPNVKVPTSNTKPLSIYGIEAKPCNRMTESECKQNSNRCDYAPPVGQQTSGTCADK